MLNVQVGFAKQFNYIVCNYVTSHVFIKSAFVGVQNTYTTVCISRILLRLVMAPVNST